MTTYPAQMTIAPQVQAFFDAATNTISYIVKDPASAACAIVDSVMDIDYAAGRITYDHADAMIAAIEAQGLVLEYQYLRNNGRVLGETIFDDGLTAIYDWENHRYDLLPVKGGTILIDCSLCEEEASTGRLRFTCAHELGHWLLHKKQFSGTGENAALRSDDESDNTLEVQANLLGSILLLPLPQVKRCFYQLRSGRTNQQLVTDMAGIFQVSKQAMRIRLENHNLL